MYHFLRETVFSCFPITDMNKNCYKLQTSLLFAFHHFPAITPKILSVLLNIGTENSI